MSEIKSSFARRVLRSSSQEQTTTEQSPIKLQHSFSSINSSEEDKPIPWSFKNPKIKRDNSSIQLEKGLSKDQTDSNSNLTQNTYKNQNEEQYWSHNNIHDSSLIPNLTRSQELRFAAESPSSLHNIRPLDKEYIRNVQSQNYNGDDDPLPGLFQEEKVLRANLKEFLSSHKQILERGTSARQIRMKILETLRNLFYINQAFVEIYSKESLRKTGILSSFNNWEDTKIALKHEIEEIKSVENEQGQRLYQITKESDRVQEEIQTLEKRLVQLKEKKSVIDKEKDRCQSVIDSRTSQYYEQLSQIENYERLAMIQLSTQNTPESSLSFNTILSKLSIIKQQSTSSINPQEQLPRLIESLTRQVDSINDNISKYSCLEQSYNEIQIIWTDMIETLNTLEIELQSVMKSRMTSPDNEDGNDQMKIKILEILKRYRGALKKRFEDLKLDKLEGDSSILKNLVGIEVETLDKGIHMLN